MKKSEEFLQLSVRSLSGRRIGSLFSKRAVNRMSNLVLDCPDHPRFPSETYVVWADSLDDALAAELRSRGAQAATQRSRFLILAKESSTDTVASTVLELGIRSPERFYAFRFGNNPDKEFERLISRLVAGLCSPETGPAILDSRIEGEELHVTSTNFEKIRIPLKALPVAKEFLSDAIKNFEVDDEGAFIYWPDLDLHLGWEQIKGIADPASALKARQQSNAFNRRFGKAIRKLRENTALKQIEIRGLSERQIQRIESGECRATTSAIQKLAKAHNLDPNTYLTRVSTLIEESE